MRAVRREPHGPLHAARADHASTARALEALVPADILALAPGRQRYTQLLDENGGIIDDLMVTRPAHGPAADGALLLVVNAARKSLDEAHLAARLPSAVALDVARDRALIALQGPDAAGVLARFVDGVATMPFMTGRPARLLGRDVRDALRLHGRGRLRDCSAGQPCHRGLGGARGRARGAPGRARRARFAAARAGAFTATSSTRPSRRSRRGSPGRFPGAARGGRLRARRIQAELANGPRRRRSASGPRGVPRRARGRRSAPTMARPSA